MIGTVSLVRIHHCTLLQFFFCLMMRTFKIYSLQLSNMQYSIVNYRHLLLITSQRLIQYKVVFFF